MSTGKPRERKCLNCRHYEASPLWRKGWCRNPLLYDAQTNHLVEAESLSCSRTFIDYWEGKDGARQVAAGTKDSRPVRRAPSIPMTPTGPGGAPLRGNTVTVAEVQASAQPRERTPQLTIVKPQSAQPAEDRTPESTLDTIPLPLVAQPVEAIAPREAEPEARVRPVTQPVPTVEDRRRRTRTVLSTGILLASLALGAIVFHEEPRQTPTAGFAVPTETVAALIPTNTAVPTRRPAPTAPPTPPPLVLAPGANAQTTGVDGVLRARQSPGLKGRIVGSVQPGVTLQIKAGPQAADGVDWWQVTGWDKKGTLAWVSGKFLKPVR